MRTTKKQKEGVLNEDLDSKLDLILEQNTEILKMKPTVDAMAEDIEVLKDDVTALKIGHKEMSQDVKEIKQILAVKEYDIN